MCPYLAGPAGSKGFQMVSGGRGEIYRTTVRVSDWGDRWRADAGW